MLILSAKIIGMNKDQVQVLLDELNKVKGIEAGYHVKKTVLEFKEIATDILINIGFPIATSIVASIIYDYFKKSLAPHNKPIIIVVNNYTFIQGEDEKTIEDKIKMLLK